MELRIVDTNGQASGTVTVADSVFGRDFNEPLVHQILVAYWAGGRAGTRAQKTRSEVRGGGAKPWRQKGTGRARAGSIRSPLWRSGGVTFASKPHNYKQKVNKRMYRAALRSILSELVRQQRLSIVAELSVAEPRTKLMLQRLQELGVGSSVLLVSEAIDDNLYLAARNLPYVEVCESAGLNPDNLLRYEHVVMTQTALDRVQEWLV